MASLPVREIVLYKHGVGFFVRGGVVSGEAVALTFKADEINDVLKSLAVFDESGGQVLGVHYQTPMDRADRLANTSINLSERAGFADLLRDLRGRRCTLTVESTPGTHEFVSGRLIGMDHVTRTERNLGITPADEAQVALLADSGEVRVFRLMTLRALQIHDTQSARDLAYFLDTSMTEDNRRVVTVRLSAGEHDLRVYYVAPSPTWRVSYRLVAESEPDAAAGKALSGKALSGKALLQGWGLFDNRLEEDLNDVRVTLVAGQPISFIYDLYASRIPQRPTVQDEARIAPGPVEFAGEALAYLEEPLEDALVAGRRAQPMAKGGTSARAQNILGLQRSAVASITAEAAAESAPPAAEGREAGETFQYLVTTPVTVKRGESALVPIVGSTVSYERELLYNGEKLPHHPVAALRFTNTSGLTLERGPVTVVEDGDYKGEAVIPFTKDGGEVYAPFAVELGVKVSERTRDYRQMVGVRFEEALLIQEEYAIYEIAYMLENSTGDEKTVMLESTFGKTGWQQSFELFDTPAPQVDSAQERRWRVTVPAHGAAGFTAKLRRRTHSQHTLTNISYKQVQEYLSKRFIDEATFAHLRELLETLQRIQQEKQHQQALEKETRSLYEQQEQQRKNLGALQATGKEADLRDRVLKQLEAAQDRLDAIAGEVETSQQALAAAEQLLPAMINRLGHRDPA